jgi:hypothetical protein
VEEEEAGEAEGANRLQLALELGLGLLPMRRAGVALGQQRTADLGQLTIDPVLVFARVAIAELATEVELEPLGQPQGLGDRVRVLGEAFHHRRRRLQHRGRVPPPQRLGLLQRHSQPHRDEGVLQVGAAPRVRVHVAGGDGGHSQPLREAGEPAVPAAVPPPAGPLQLDPEAIAAEGAEQPPGRLRACRDIAPLPGAGDRAGSSASREAEQPGRVLFYLPEGDPRLPSAPLRAVARMGMRCGEQTTETAVAGRVFDQQRQVRVPGRRSHGAKPRPGHLHCHLRAGDRLDLQGHAGLDELHRSPDPVVVGQRERRVAQARRSAGQLRRRRGPVEEGEGGVSVQLDVGSRGRHQPRCRYQRSVTVLRKTTMLRPSARTSSK